MKQYDYFIEEENGYFVDRTLGCDDQRAVFHIDGLRDSLGIEPSITFEARAYFVHASYVPFIRKEDLKVASESPLLSITDNYDCNRYGASPQYKFLKWMSDKIINPLLRKYGMNLYPCLRDKDSDLEYQIFGLQPGIGRDLLASFLDPAHSVPYVGFFIKGLGYVSLNLEKAAFILSGDDVLAKRLIRRGLSNVPNINKNLLEDWIFEKIGNTGDRYKNLSDDDKEWVKRKLEEELSKSWKKIRYSWDRILSHLDSSTEFAVQIVKEKALVQRIGRSSWTRNFGWHNYYKVFNYTYSAYHTKNRRWNKGGTTWSKFLHENKGAFKTKEQYQKAYHEKYG